MGLGGVFPQARPLGGLSFCHRNNAGKLLCQGQLCVGHGVRRGNCSLGCKCFSKTQAARACTGRGRGGRTGVIGNFTQTCFPGGGARSLTGTPGARSRAISRAGPPAPVKRIQLGGRPKPPPLPPNQMLASESTKLDLGARINAD